MMVEYYCLSTWITRGSQVPSKSELHRKNFPKKVGKKGQKGGRKERMNQGRERERYWGEGRKEKEKYD